MLTQLNKKLSYVNKVEGKLEGNIFIKGRKISSDRENIILLSFLKKVLTET